MAKILIVDDHPTNRELMVTLLGYQQHQLIEAKDGYEALALARAERPELIISDVLMPTMDGYEFVRQLRADQDIAGTTVIFSTAHYLGREARALAAACGVEHVLPKPVDPAVVLEVTAAALRSQQIAVSEAAAPVPDLDGVTLDRRHLRLVTDALAEKDKAVQTANARMAVLLDFGLKLGTERDADRLIEIAVQAARTLVGASYALLVLPTDGARRQKVVVGGLSESMAGQALVVSASAAIRTMLVNRNPVLIDDAPDATALLGLPPSFPGVRSGLAAPIQTPQKVHGWLCLAGKIGGGSFSDEDCDLIVMLGSKVGRVLESVLLYADLADYARRLEDEVAEHKRTADALHVSRRDSLHAEARYRAVVETAVDAMVVIDERGIIHSFNRAAERMFGYAAEEVVGNNVSMLMAEPHRSRHDGYVARYKATGEARIIGIGREVEGRRKDGTMFPLDLSIAEWHVGGERYFTGIMRDITERKAAERAVAAARDEALAAKEEAERANLAKSKFLAAASHDLRQPAQSLVLFTSALAGQLQGHPSYTLIKHMEQALDGLRILLDALLNVSRLDAGVVVPQEEAFPLGELLMRLGTEYQLQALHKGLALAVVPTSAWTRSDRALLERILRNLIENALRYTPAGSILVGCRRRREMLVLQVLDTGSGIPEDKLETVFEEFYQVGNPERDRSQGLGLGLAIVRRLARLLGHDVTVVSTPGLGSCFAVTVPMLPAALSTAPRPMIDGGLTATGQRVLIVEDEDVVRAGLEVTVRGWGYQVVAAGCFEEAVRAYQGQPAPDLIIADYRLREGCTGLAVIGRLQALFGRAVPSIILTGDTAPDLLSEVQASGVQILHKPIAAEQLREAIQSAICDTGR